MDTPQTPTDRGYAVIFEDEKGLNLAVCTEVVNGRPQEVFAVHLRVQRLDIGKGITFVGTGKVRYTSWPVAVFAEPGVVHVKPSLPRNDLAVAKVP